MTEKQVNEIIKTPEVKAAFERIKLKTLPKHVKENYDKEDEEFEQQYSQNTNRKLELVRKEADEKIQQEKEARIKAEQDLMQAEQDRIKAEQDRDVHANTVRTTVQNMLQMNFAIETIKKF